MLRVITASMDATPLLGRAAPKRGGSAIAASCKSSTTQLLLLLRKQALQKKRGWCSTIFELVCPAASVLIMVLLFTLAGNKFTVGAKAGAAFTPVGTMQITDVRASFFADLLLPWTDPNATDIEHQYGVVPLSDFPSLLPEWNTLDSVSRVAIKARNMRIALAPSTHPAFAAFKAALLAQSPGIDIAPFTSARHPNLKGCSVPALSELVRDFESEAAIEAYITGPNYPLEKSAGERIFAAIVLEDGAPHWKYKIRANTSTFGLDITTGRVVDQLVRGIEGDALSAYVNPTFHGVGMTHLHMRKQADDSILPLPSTSSAPGKSNFDDKFTTWGFSVLQVSVLLYTVTFYANRAHNLTRSP